MNEVETPVPQAVRILVDGDLDPRQQRRRPLDFIDHDAGGVGAEQPARILVSCVAEVWPLEVQGSEVGEGRPRQRRLARLTRADQGHRRCALFHGFSRVALAEGQDAFVATPEKALLDLVHLEPGGDRPDYLEGLRLQGLAEPGTFDLDRLARDADRSGSPKLRRAAAHVARLAASERDDWEAL